MSSHHSVGWDKIYHRYRPEDLPWELGKPRKALVELVETGRVKPGETLDLCCGAGSNTVYLAMKGFNVTALDVSEKAIEYAREKAAEAKVDISFLVGSFLKLPFRIEEFTFAFDFGCFHHVDADLRTLFVKELWAVLKPGANYFLACFSHKNGPAWNHFRREQIYDLFQPHFTVETIEPVSSLEGDGVIRHFYQVFMQVSKVETSR